MTWESEFDEKFKDLISHCLNCECGGHPTLDIKALKSFIADQIAKAKEEGEKIAWNEERPEYVAFLQSFRAEIMKAERARIYRIVEGTCRTWDISKGGFSELGHAILEEIKKDI